MRKWRRALALAAVAASGTVVTGSAPAQMPMLVDLANHRIHIDAAFTGAELLLFGALDRRGDVVVRVVGPPTEIAVRQKINAGGIWLNGDRVGVGTVPSFYSVAASRPLDAIASADLRQDLELDVRYQVRADVPDAHRAGFIRNFTRRGLYAVEQEPVKIIGGRLFRATVTLPAETPPGEYWVETLLFREGTLAHRRINRLLVERVGFESFLFDLAQERPAEYGLLAVVLALAMGVTAAEVFRRV